MVIGPNDESGIQVISVMWMMIRKCISVHPIALKIGNSYKTYKVELYNLKTWWISKTYFLTILEDGPVNDYLSLLMFYRGYLIPKNLKQARFRDLRKMKRNPLFLLFWITELKGICLEFQIAFLLHAHSDELLVVVLHRERFRGPARRSRKEYSHLFISNSIRRQEMRWYMATCLFISDLWFNLLMSPMKSQRLKVFDYLPFVNRCIYL